MKSMNYKPGWWALYFLYILIPVSAYVWYLCRQVKEVYRVGVLVCCIQTHLRSIPLD